VSAYPATPEWIQKAKEFVAEKWAQRAVEFGREKPRDLKGACKFCSLFAQELFGGELRGNWHHQFVVLDGKTIDLTEGSEGSDRYDHDDQFWGNREHRESLASCRPRVEQWVAEFQQRYPITKTASAPVGLIDWNHPQEGLTTSFETLHAIDPRMTAYITNLLHSNYGVAENDIPRTRPVRIQWVSPDTYFYETMHGGAEVERHIKEIADVMKQGTKFLPAVFKGETWLDGNHRVKAARRNGNKKVPAIDLRAFNPQFDEEKELKEKQERDKAEVEQLYQELSDNSGSPKVAASKTAKKLPAKFRLPSKFTPYVKWMVHDGTIMLFRWKTSDGVETCHADVAYEIGWPFSGRAYDSMPRGTAWLNDYRKKIVLTSYGGNADATVYEDVAYEITKYFNLSDEWTPEYENLYVYASKQASATASDRYAEHAKKCNVCDQEGIECCPIGERLLMLAWEELQDEKHREDLAKTAELESNESLITLLEPEWGGLTGPEKEKKLSPTVSVFTSPYGSYRFVKFKDGEPVAAMQVVSQDKRGNKAGYICNMYALSGYRRMGIGFELYAHAKQLFKGGLTFSNDLSNQGKAFVKGVGGKTAALQVKTAYETLNWSDKRLREYVSGWLAGHCRKGKPGIEKHDCRVDGSGYWLYRDDSGKAVAFVAFDPNMVTDMGVAPPARRRGIMTKLLNALEQEKGITQIKPPYTRFGEQVALKRDAVPEGK
jgi:ribosomal protein S18 acetylase RimI-like enzyme